MYIAGALRALLVLAFVLFAMPSPAQVSEALPGDWQAVITRQIEALRRHDAKLALSFAAAGFRDRFSDPERFLAVIVATGYAPIIESQSHRFGRFAQVAPDLAIQEVRFTGAKQDLYEAVYQMQREAEGWRVLGVQLAKRAGIGV